MKISSFIIPLISALAACAPMVTISPEASSIAVNKVAVLPVETEEDVQRERTDYLMNALYRELSTSGFTVLSTETTKKVCNNSPECPNKDELFKKYGVDGVAKLHLNGTYKVNALAGYYNAVSGVVTVQDKFGTELAKVEHSESERGGILFNTGQLIEALRSTSSNASEDSFPKLADKFAIKISQLLPRPNGQSSVTTEDKAISIAKVEFTPFKGNFRICADGTPNVAASAIISQSRLKLREVKNGRYCSALLTSVPTQTAALIIELRTPYGRTAQKELNLPASLTCNPTPLVARSDSGALTIGCQNKTAECETQWNHCISVDFIVFKSNAESGPYSRIASVKGHTWSDSGAPADIYSVIAVSPVGISSAPIVLAKK